MDDLPDRLNWRALRAFVFEGAQQQGTALYRSIAGEDHVWGLTEHLLATVADALHVANWQRGNAGRKQKTKKPKPIPRPGVGRKKMRGSTLPLSAARALFSRHNPGAFN